MLLSRHSKQGVHMSMFWKRSLALIAVVGLAGCGGPVEETPETEVSSTEQALRSCKPYEPPCPSGYECISGVCRPILAR
jgi:hypothetical protein